jgi:hypothetical protein
MMLADAIESALSEHAVYFLLTAYIESLQHFHTSLHIPQCVIALPLAGMDDLAERVQSLRELSTATDRNAAPDDEALAMLECALERLRTLARSVRPHPASLSDRERDSRALLPLGEGWG